MNTTKFYFAPMEGVTDCYFRKIHASLFARGRADKYFAPFVSPSADTLLTERDKKALSAESNPGISVVPQILCNQSVLFVRTSLVLRELGYREINLNLGCPSGTVVTKHKGAGFLSDPDALDRFFDGVFKDPAFSGSDLRVSVKTRLGMDSPEEFDELLPVFCRYPFSELILHPRVRREQYRGVPHREYYSAALSKCPYPVCYNGDIFTGADYDALCAGLSADPLPIPAVMLGRGLVSNPAMIAELRGGEPLTKAELSAFADALCEDAVSRLSGERHILFRMKELWAYWIPLFEEETAKPYLRKMRKTLSLAEFRTYTAVLLADCPFSAGSGFSGSGSL